MAIIDLPIQMDFTLTDTGESLCYFIPENIKHLLMIIVYINTQAYALER